MSNFDMDGYVDVSERLRLLREKHPDASLQGSYEIVEVNGTTHVVYRAECYRTADDVRPGVGYAWEQVPGRTPFTKTSELMNAETSAWGRAIVAALAADTKRVASADEISNAPAYASEEDRGEIVTRLSYLPTELRAQVSAELRARYGPARDLLERDVSDVIEYIEDAREEAEPFAASSSAKEDGSVASGEVASDPTSDEPSAPKNEDGSDAPRLLENGAWKPQDNSSLAGNITNVRADADVI